MRLQKNVQFIMIDNSTEELKQRLPLQP